MRIKVSSRTRIELHIPTWCAHRAIDSSYFLPLLVLDLRVTTRRCTLGYATGSEGNCTSGMCCRANNHNNNSPNKSLVPAPRYGWFQWCVRSLTLELLIDQRQSYEIVTPRYRSPLPYSRPFLFLLVQRIRVLDGPYTPVILSHTIRKINYLGESHFFEH